MDARSGDDRSPFDGGCNVFVRYLLDAQLFTVPNNQRHFAYLLAYLHHERLFDLTYVVAMRDRQIRGSASGWWSGTDDGIVAVSAAAARRRRAADMADAAATTASIASPFANGGHEKRSRKSRLNRQTVGGDGGGGFGRNNSHGGGNDELGGGGGGGGDDNNNDDDDDDDTACTRIYDDLVSGRCNVRVPLNQANTPSMKPTGFYTNVTNTAAVAAPTTFSPSSFTVKTTAPISVRQPVTRYDVRDLFQNVVLTGDENEWLELKLQICLPSIVVFLKLDGSKTVVPNADKTLVVSMRELRALQDKRTLGEKIAILLAEFRRRYFGAPLPSMQQIAFLATVDAYEIEHNTSIVPPIKSSLSAAAAAAAAAASGVRSTTNSAIPSYSSSTSEPTVSRSQSLLSIGTTNNNDDDDDDDGDDTIGQDLANLRSVDSNASAALTSSTIRPPSLESSLAQAMSANNRDAEYSEYDDNASSIVQDELQQFSDHNGYQDDGGNANDDAASTISPQQQQQQRKQNHRQLLGGGRVERVLLLQEYD